MSWKSIVEPRAMELDSAPRPATSGLARETARTVSDLVSLLRNLVADVRDSYRPELHFMRGPGPKWRAKHGPYPHPSSSRTDAAGFNPATSDN
jgi:hypothetical protein